MLNGNALNVSALNAESEPFVPTLTGQGTLVSIEQNIRTEASGTLISIEQEIELYVTASGVLISVEQEVQKEASGTVVSIEQNVLTPAAVIPNVTPDGNRIGPYWDLTIAIDGNIVPPSWVHGQVRVSRNESSTALMDVTLIPSGGVQDLDSYTGKSITVDVSLPNLVTRRIYTGVVDIPEIDLINKKITLRCSDRREEQLSSIIAPYLSGIGEYSSVIFGEDTTDKYQVLTNRLSTSPTAVDFDSYGNLRITPWAAKDTADFLLEDDEVYRRDPHVELTSRARITNTVDIEFQYRYERLHQWEANYTWESPIKNNFGLFLLQGYSMARRDMILAAIDAAGWPVRGEVTFDPIQPAGWYSGIGWKTTSWLSQNVVRTDANGDAVTDASGNPVYDTILTGGVDLTKIMTNGASWVGTTRWAQTITEDHVLKVKAPQSIAQYGTIAQNAGYSIQDPFESNVWENYTSYNEIPGQSNTFFVNRDTTRAQFNSASRVALLRAKNTILGSHRDTRVSISREIWPQVELHHTVQIATDPVQARGKVSEITHYFDINSREAYTEVVLVLSQSSGSASDSTLSAPSIAADSVNLPTPSITLDNHFGISPDPETNPDSVNWTGMIGNKYVSGSLYRTNYTEQFRVDTPAIPASVRNEKIRSKTTEYDVEIPDDFLIVTF